MNQSKFNFTFSNLRNQYSKALSLGYKFITCLEYFETKSSLQNLTIINRVDVDFSIKKANELKKIFDDLGIKATFFIRLHAPEYNPFSFDNYKIIKSIISSGHEIGYHSEIIDQSVIWDENAKDCLIKDINIINTMFDIKIKGVASHGGMTGLNNLDFWMNNNPNSFNLLYEAYENSITFDLFKNSFYISDSEWVRWKSYNNGILCNNDNRSFGDHLDSMHNLIYLLIHPDTYYYSHFYEN